MNVHRVSCRGATGVVAWVFLQLLAACTPVREPARCEGSDKCPTSSSASMKDSDAAIAQPPVCTRDADCETSGPCETVHCEDQRCVRTPVPSGNRLPESDQVIGDCRTIECNGEGRARARNDDTDSPMSDGNPCHARSCSNGEIETTTLPDGSECNAGGVCERGECSKCFDGADCTGVEDCSVMKVRCDAGKSTCESTHEPISGKICGAGKVCSEGECSECRVGASCGAADPCYLSRITSCDPRICERTALTGTSCGTDAEGHAQVCNAGKCSYACDKNSCASATTESCMQATAVCAQPDAEPTCLVTPVADGVKCEQNGTCNNGACKHSALVNGDFSRGFEGWTLTGDAQSFRISEDQDSYRRWTVSTWVEGVGGSATGSVSQSFVVPNDALAIRFNVWGGEGTVQLRNASGEVLERVDGTNRVDNRIPASWDLSARRGQTLTIAIEDDIASDATWAYVNATGFDVIRDTPGPMINPAFRDQLVGWEASGDGPYFNVYNDWNYGAPEHRQYDPWGRRISVSTYARSGTARLGASTVGTLSQTFTVPADATAMRFNICGGKRTHVALYDGATQLYVGSPRDDDSLKVPVSWDLSDFRGKALRVVIVDEVSSNSFDYLGVSGFDILTAYNGP